MADLTSTEIAARLRAMSDELATLADAVEVDEPPTPEPGPEPQPQPSARGVTVHGMDLLIDGVKRQVAGWNLFGASGCHQGQPYSDAALDGFFQSLPKRSITRTWGFRPQGIDNLRHVVEAARRNDQLLLVSLGDGVSYCGDEDGASRGAGSAKTPAWYQSGYRKTYRPWVDQVTREFADHPAVGGFEPMNEPIGQSGATLRAFYDDIGGLCHTNAPTKLVFSGQRGLYDFADQVTGWKLAHASPGIDVCSLHSYDFDYKGSKRLVTGWWDQTWNTARDLGKPLIVGEEGIGVPGNTGATQATRAAAFREKFTAYFDLGASAVLVWNRYLGPSDEMYAVDGADDPLVGVVRDSSR